jgi:FAD/FMN-containing dehydrogenase
MAPHLADRVYMNFLDGDEARQNTRHAFSAGQYQRLKHIKAKYDPQNIFRFGFDIQPSS